MTSLKHREHARQKPSLPPLELARAVALRAFSNDRPALAGLLYTITEYQMEGIRKNAKPGIENLTRAASERLNMQDDTGGVDTRGHCAEVAFISYIMAREVERYRPFIDMEAAKRGAAGPNGIDPELCFVGGFLHDIGKTFIPPELMSKESGVRVLFRQLFKGAAMTEVERASIRYEHIRAGTEYVRTYGGNGHMRMVLDMVGLHHVMYNGLNSSVPSYPEAISGKKMTIYGRISKAADFLSAILPREYRCDNWVTSSKKATAHAMAIAGMELDPLVVCCFLTGTHDLPPEQALKLIDIFSHPDGQEGISDRAVLRRYVEGEVMESSVFAELASRWDMSKLTMYEEEAKVLAQRYGFPPLTEVSPLNIKNKYADAA